MFSLASAIRKLTHMFSPALSTTIPRVKVTVGWFLLRALERLCPSLSPSSWRFAGYLWCPLAHGDPSSMSVLMSLAFSPSPLYKDTSHLGQWFTCSSVTL